MFNPNGVITTVSGNPLACIRVKLVMVLEVVLQQISCTRLVEISLNTIPESKEAFT
jgi:hypothetical protein